jgi:hypothetical protein
MSRRVYKFGRIGFNWTTIEIPTGFMLGRFGIQNQCFYFWAEVDTNALAIKKEFIVMPTGCDVPVDGLYIDTVINEESGTVWHLYMKV